MHVRLVEVDCFKYLGSQVTADGFFVKGMRYTE